MGHEWPSSQYPFDPFAMVASPHSEDPGSVDP